MWRSRSIAMQRLISLFDLATSPMESLNRAPSSAVITRWASSSSSAELLSDRALKFAKNRKSYESRLSVLRKQWAVQQAEREARAAAAAQVVTARKEAAKSRRAQEDAAGRGSRTAEILARQQEEREVKARAKAERLRRQELRNDILEAARASRQEALLRASRHWITDESFDTRVLEALENPVPLWDTAHRQT